MKKILLTAFLTIAPCLASTDNNEQNHTHTITDLNAFAHHWAQAAVTDLNQEELELLGSFLYFDVSSSQYEIALRNSLLDMQRGSQVLSFKLMNLGNMEQALELSLKLKELFEKVDKEITPARNYFLMCWQECNKQIEESNHANLKIAIDQLKQLGQRSLNNWSKTNKDEIIKLLEKNSDSLETIMSKMNTCKNALDELANETFPFTQETEFIEIQLPHHAINVSQVLYEALFRASLATDEIMSISFALINFNSLIFSSLYHAFYNALEEKHMLPMHVVINENGLIPVESRSAVLPPFSVATNKE